MHSNELVDRLVRMKCNVGACVYAQYWTGGQIGVDGMWRECMCLCTVINWWIDWYGQNVMQVCVSMHSNELVDRLVWMECTVGVCIYAQQ